MSKEYNTPNGPEFKHVNTTDELALLRALNAAPMLTPQLEAAIDDSLGMPVHGALFGSAFDPDRYEDEDSPFDRLAAMEDEDLDREPTRRELAECAREFAA